ncbi:MAG TPA: bL28 family ribosomal protein [Patescibacteria group bacterium]|nr:bL28 family ribosomal protein [Patescibacteria group bacterium]
MSMICDNCGKGRQRGHRVSHAKNRSIHFFKPNLHRHLGRLLCARCIKKTKSIAKIPAVKSKTSLRDRE